MTIFCFSAHEHFERLIKCLESYLHPLQEGGHTLTLQTFLGALVNEIVRRVRAERVRRKTKDKVRTVKYMCSHSQILSKCLSGEFFLAKKLLQQQRSIYRLTVQSSPAEDYDHCRVLSINDFIRSQVK